MAVHTCYNCVYGYCDPEVWLRDAYFGEPLLVQCANHPWWPGRMHDVSGVPCRNYRPKPKLPGGDAVRLIPLGDGFYAYVDAADYEWLSRYRWFLHNGYAGRREKNKVVLMHREITRAPKGMVVDHVDANKVNNCRFNLRVCTPDENRYNLGKKYGSRSRFKGVTYNRRLRKWLARCRFKGRVYCLGYYDDEVEAARAYDHKAVELFGEFARLNFPEEWPPERRAQVHAEFSRRGESSFARKPVRARKSKKPRTEDRRRRTDKAKEGKSKKAKGKRDKAKPRATRAGRRATKQGKRSRAETPGRRVHKRRATPARVAGRRSRATASKRRQP